MHTYDVDRHTWRYDVGGYAWDNSELSLDLFFWNYFLRTGREDVYRFAEALTRANSETDVYHLGRFKGLGTRHGVQHWGDSGKQARISQPQYRKPFHYLTGSDERTGELLSETLSMSQTFLSLDPNRKIRTDNYTQIPTNSVGAISLSEQTGPASPPPGYSNANIEAAIGSPLAANSSLPSPESPT